MRSRSPTITPQRFVAVAEVDRQRLSEYPERAALAGRMKALKSWKKVNEMIDGFGASLKGQPMVAV